MSKAKNEYRLELTFKNYRKDKTKLTSYPPSYERFNQKMNPKFNRFKPNKENQTRPEFEI